MLDLETLELRWRSDAGEYLLTLDNAGRPRLIGPGGRAPDAADSSAALPERPGPPRNRSSSPERPVPVSRGQKWTPEDEVRAADAFSAGIPTSSIGLELGRTDGAVRARLVRMGLMSEEEAGLRYPTRAAAGGPDAPVAAEPPAPEPPAPEPPASEQHAEP